MEDEVFVSDRFQVLIDYLDGTHDCVMTAHSPSIDLYGSSSSMPGAPVLNIWEFGQLYHYPLCNVKRWTVHDVIG